MTISKDIFIKVDTKNERSTATAVDCQTSIGSLEFDYELETHQFGKTEKDQPSLFKERDGGFTLFQMEFNVYKKQRSESAKF